MSDATASEEAAASTPVDGTSTNDVPFRVEDLHKRFGGIVAVDGASFSVERASVTGLIGPNSAGKSTTFNCITGVHKPDSGRVLFEGEDITGLAPNQVANKGWSAPSRSPAGSPR